jgi:hypothetical protein
MTTRGDVLPVGPPVQLEWQIGRTRDIEEVRLAVEGCEHIVLIDVRRTGKSTVALGAMEQLARAGCMVFLLDAREGSPDSAELARRLRHQLCAYRTAKGKLFSGASRAVNTLYEIGLGVTTLIDDPATRAAVAGAMQALNREQHSGAQELDAVLREISAEAESQDCSAVVLIDEVQAITALPDRRAIEALFRDRLAARGAPSLVFAGSERTAMETLFAEGRLRCTIAGSLLEGQAWAARSSLERPQAQSSELLPWGRGRDPRDPPGFAGRQVLRRRYVALSELD